MKTKGKILVVDDDPNLRKTLSDILRVKGYETAVAASGAEAIAAAEHETFSLALIDLMLPDMPGLEVMARIKAISPPTEVIILTGHASMDTAIEAIRQGAYSYLFKPYQMEDLLQKIRYGVERQQAQEEIIRLASFPRLHPSPVIELNSSGEVTYANPVAEKLFPDLISMGRSHPLLMDCKIFNEFRQSKQQADVIREVEVGRATYELHAHYIQGLDLVRIYVMDITEHKRLEWQLAEREALFSAIFNQTSIGIELIDPETLRFVEANPAACRMLGYSHEEFLSLRLADTQADLNEQALLAVVRQVDEAGGMTMENRHRCKNGDFLDVEINSRMLDLPGKRLLVGVWSDVTKRKRQETLLHFRLKLIDMASQVDHLHLMQATLDIAEALTGSTIGFFHYVENDQETISLQAWSTNTLENMCNAEGSGQHYPVSQAGVWADAIRTKTPVIQNDYPHLASKKGMPEGHAVVERFVSVPIFRNNKIVALIGVGNKSSNYDDADIEIVSQLADLVFDLIEANKTHLALRESEEKFRKITESAQDAIIMMGANECISAWNAAAERLFGYSEAEAIGRELHPLITPHEAQLAFKHGFPHFLRTGTGPIIGKVSEVIALRKGGETFPVEVSLASLQIDGQWSAIGIFRDITERKRADENLRITASVFENSQEGIVITDANNVFLDVNPAFTQITGYTREEVIGKNPRLLSSGRQDKAFYSAMWQSLKQERAWRGEIWNRRKSGEIYAELLSVSTICDDDGRVQRYVGVFSDISYLKAHEFELSRIAHYDALTGIPNRVLLADRMKQAIAQTAREQNMMAVCYLDLDGFKLINDTMGHEAGDQVLIKVAKRIGNTIRGGDTVARLGGDEFVVLLLGQNKSEECVTTLERLLAAISLPIIVKNNPITVGASIGVSIYPLDDEDQDTLLRHADQAMYVAKQSGKNRFHIFDPEPDMLARNHLCLERPKF